MVVPVDDVHLGCTVDSSNLMRDIEATNARMRNMTLEAIDKKVERRDKAQLVDDKALVGHDKMVVGMMPARNYMTNMELRGRSVHSQPEKSIIFFYVVVVIFNQIESI